MNAPAAFTKKPQQAMSSLLRRGGDKSTKSEPNGFGFARFGGGEGSRTPVRKHVKTSFSERSL